MEFMKMKKKTGIAIIIVVLALLGTGIAVFATGCFSGKTADSETSEQLYTCGMHPWVVQEGPGQCPICGMNLVPKENQAETASASGEREILYYVSSMDPGYVRQEPGKDTMGMDLVPVYADQVTSGAGVTVDASIIQSIGVRYATVEKGPMSLSINAPAHVDYNEDHLAVLSTRTDGYIDKLYVTSPGATVKAGDPLFDFYAPQLYSAQEEYLIALRIGDSSLSNAARERLKLLGVSDTQIDAIRQNGSSSALPITAPMDGIVVTMGGTGTGGGLPQGGGSLNTGGGMGGGSAPSGGGGMGGMGGGGGGGGFSDSGGSSSISGMQSGSGGTLREGAFVSAGSPVFTIADLSTVWVYAHIYSDQLPYVHVGMPATLELDYLPGESFQGTIDFVYPYLETLTRDIRVRIVFPNPDGKLIPAMYGTVKIQSQISENALTIPEEAVIYSGDHRVVFLALAGNRFMPAEVTLGPSDGNGKVQVLSGLVEGQQIITSAQFLIDSESRMQEAISKMLAGQSNTTAAEGAVSTVQPEEQPAQSTDDTMAGMDMPAEEQPAQTSGDTMAAPSEEQPAQTTDNTMAGMDMPAEEQPAQTSGDTMAAPSEEQPAQTTDNTMAGMDMPAETWPNLAPDDPTAIWKCPMPEDRYYAAEPGDCPICGMHLVPHDPVAWAAEQSETNQAGE
jgi:membrane fusion protein, copper/silver efflux system